MKYEPERLVKMINLGGHTSNVEESVMPLSHGFKYDYGENEWDREDLDLCMWETHKMDGGHWWSLNKFDDSHEEGEYELFRGSEDEMSEFVGKYIRENKLSQVLDG